MRINFDAVIMDLKNKPVMQEDKDGKDGRSPLTLSTVVCISCLNQYEDERSMTGDQKVKRFKLAQKAVDGGEVDLKADEIAELKVVVAKAWTPLVVARAYAMLDPDPPEEEPKVPAKPRKE